MQQIAEWIVESGLTRSEIARRAGVARTTLDRIESGEGNPTLATLDDIAYACGKSIDIIDRPLCDPAAAEAARVLLDADYEPYDRHSVGVWARRLERAVPDSDPVAVLTAAAHASSVLRRRDTTTVTGNLTDLAVASAGDGSRGDYALSGAPGLGMKGTILLWAEDAPVAARLLVETAKRAPQRAHNITVIVAPARANLFQNAFTTDRGIRFVAPLQIMLDNIGLGDEYEKAALTEVRSW
jgi:transcriptional regulator with XRE-family HTH domain